MGPGSPAARLKLATHLEGTSYFFLRDFFFAPVRVDLLVAAFFRRLLPPRPKINSQPSAYFFVLPTRTMLIAYSPLPHQTV